MLRRYLAMVTDGAEPVTRPYGPNGRSDDPDSTAYPALEDTHARVSGLRVLGHPSVLATSEQIDAADSGHASSLSASGDSSEAPAPTLTTIRSYRESWLDSCQRTSSRCWLGVSPPEPGCADTRQRLGAGERGRGARLLRGRWLPGLEERARHRRAEDAVPFDLFVQVPQPIAVALHGEVGHGPDHLAEEEDHRADIEELEL